MGKYYHYFVEGENEEKIIQVLKSDLRMIEPGKVQKFNVIEQKLTKLRLMSLKPGTTVILVFDTDTGNAETLQKNIEFLQDQSTIKDVLCIMQVKNLEDVLKDNHFDKKLLKSKFDMDKFWCTTDKVFKNIKNDASKIKLKKSA